MNWIPSGVFRDTSTNDFTWSVKTLPKVTSFCSDQFIQPFESANFLKRLNLQQFLNTPLTIFLGRQKTAINSVWIRAGLGVNTYIEIGWNCHFPNLHPVVRLIEFFLHASESLDKSTCIYRQTWEHVRKEQLPALRVGSIQSSAPSKSRAEITGLNVRIKLSITESVAAE